MVHHDAEKSLDSLDQIKERHLKTRDVYRVVFGHDSPFFRLTVSVRVRVRVEVGVGVRVTRDRARSRRRHQPENRTGQVLFPVGRMRVALMTA